MPREIWQLEDYVRFSESPDVRVRSWALERLRDLCGSEAVAPIARLLHDTDEFIACMAPAFLAEQGAVEHAPAILKRFREASAEGPVANACALALGKLGYEKAAPALAGRLESCEPLAFLGIVKALGELGGDRAGQALANLLRGVSRNDSTAAAVFEAALGLGEPELIELAAGRYLELPGPPPGEENEILGAFRRATHSQDPFDAFTGGLEEGVAAAFRRAEEALGRQLGDLFTASYLATLERLWKQGAHGGVMFAVADEAAARLERSEPSGEVPEPCRSLSAEFERRRATGYALLAAFGRHKDKLKGRGPALLAEEAAFATAVLLRAAAEQDYGRLLAEADDETGALLGVLGEGPAGLPVEIIQRTATLGEEAVEPLLAIMGGDAPERGRVRAAWAMSLLARAHPRAAERAIPALVRGLAAENPRTYQEDCAQALREIGVPAIDEIVPLLDEGDPHGRRQALEVLSDIPAEEAADTILERLDRLAETNYADTLEALRKLGSGKATGPLQALWDGREVDAAEVLMFLAEMSGQETPGLAGLREESEARLRRQAEDLGVIRGTGRPRRAIQGGEEPLAVLLRCQRCGRAYEYPIQRAYSDDSIAERALVEGREEDFYLAVGLACAGCGEEDRFEITSEGFLTLAAEQVRGSELTRGGNRRMVGTSRLKFIPFATRAGERMGPGQALDFYREALEREPDDPELHLGLAEILARVDRLEEAEGEYNRALTLAPRSAEAYLGLGEVLAAKGEDSKAAEMYQQATEMAPRDGEVAERARCALARLSGSEAPERPGPRPTVGRNDPCPCGSGKKHKHCCLKKGAS